MIFAARGPNLSSCREQHYSHHPYQAYCPLLNVTLHYEWKSRMWSAFDHKFLQRATKAAHQHSNVIVILNGGPHHFAQFLDHSHTYYFAMHDSFDYPQRWFDSYLQGATSLFEHSSKLLKEQNNKNMCVLWRTGNIGPRLGDEPGKRPKSTHHPSTRNGLHEWLNRWSSALARSYGIPVLDLTDITMGNPVPSKWVHGESAKSAFKTVSKQEEQTKIVVEGRRLFLETEGDLYHGYNSSLLLLPFVERACALCNGRG